MILTTFCAVDCLPRCSHYVLGGSRKHLSTRFQSLVFWLRARSVICSTVQVGDMYMFSEQTTRTDFSKNRLILTVCILSALWPSNTLKTKGPVPMQCTVHTFAAIHHPSIAVRYQASWLVAVQKTSHRPKANIRDRRTLQQSPCWPAIVQMIPCNTRTDGCLLYETLLTFSENSCRRRKLRQQAISRVRRV